MASSYKMAFIGTDEVRQMRPRDESYRDEFLILHFTAGKRRRQLHLEPLQECFQLAAVPFCQLLSHLHLFSQSIMKHCNLFMGYSGSSCENV